MTLIDRAFEVDALVIGTPETHQVVLAAGGTLPYVSVGASQAPVYYFRSTGEVFRKDGPGGSPLDWAECLFAPTNAEIRAAAGGIGGTVPVQLAGGQVIGLAVAGGFLPVRLTDGQDARVALQ